MSSSLTSASIVVSKGTFTIIRQIRKASLAGRDRWAGTGTTSLGAGIRQLWIGQAVIASLSRGSRTAKRLRTFHLIYASRSFLACHSAPSPAVLRSETVGV